jgi:hypothetical protein
MVSISSDGLLIYGYDLGAEEEWEDLPEWFKGLPDAPDYDGFVDAALEYLMKQSGLFTETDWEAEGYWQRKHAAELEMGIDIAYHCSYEYPMYILAIKAKQGEHRAYRGSPIYIEADTLNIPPAIKDEWDAKLRWAVDTLGIKTVIKEPSWILTSILG